MQTMTMASHPAAEAMTRSMAWVSWWAYPDHPDRNQTEPRRPGRGNFPGFVVNRARRVDGVLQTPGAQGQVAGGMSRGGLRARWVERLQQPVAGADRCLV